MREGGYVTTMTFAGAQKNYLFRIDFPETGGIRAEGIKGKTVEAPDFQFLVYEIRKLVEEHENSS